MGYTKVRYTLVFVDIVNHNLEHIYMGKFTIPSTHDVPLDELLQFEYRSNEIANNPVSSLYRSRFQLTNISVSECNVL